MTTSPITQRFVVDGMTCGHCVAAVNEEVGGVDGVTAVRVDLDSGALEVESVAPVDRAAVAAAVEEAGYTLVGAPR
jgi:copper ion binding protein